MIPVNELPLTMSFLRPSGRAMCLLTALSLCLPMQTGFAPETQARSASSTTGKHNLLAKKEKEEKEEKKEREQADKKEKKKRKAGKEEPAAEDKVAKDKVAEDEDDAAPDEEAAAKKPGKKKRGFFFGGKGKKEDEKSEPESRDDEEEVVEVDIIENKPEKKDNNKEESKESAAAGEKAPRLLPDAALISLLKDVTKALRELDEETSGVDQPDEKLIVELARQILESSLNGDELEADRILRAENKKAATTTMTVEAWSSGAVEISDKFKGSVAAVWAKKVGGLLNVTIAGDCQDKNLGDGSKVGKFIVVVSAKSPVQKGFDIQSQSQVDFWICELGDVDVDAACMKPEKKESEEKGAEAEGEDDEEAADQTDENSVKKKSLIVLEPILTDRKRKYLAELALYNTRLEELAALKEQEKAEQEKAEQEKAEKDRTKQQKQEEKEKEVTKKTVEEPKNLTVESEFAQIQDQEEETEKPAVASIEPEKREPEKKEPEKKEPEEPEPAKIQPETKEPETKEPETKEPEKTEPGQKEAEARQPEKQESEKQQPEKNTDYTEETAAVRHGWQEKDETPGGSGSDNTHTQGQNLTRISSLPLSPASARSRWESPAPSMITREPSLDARVLLPERAIAGKFLTVAVLTRSNEPERAVELSFNGATMTTDNAGQAMFMVPEDATPGRTLNVSLSARPELNPGVIDVLQPLTLSSGSESSKRPSIDSTSPMATSSRVLVVNGHDFEGLAGQNRVLVDGDSEAKVVAASPVQLRIALPEDLAAGSHTVLVESQGTRSNSARFEYIKAEVTAEEKKKEISRFIVTVKGTQSPVHVRVINRTPDVVKLSKGDSIIVTTSGGSHNHYSLGAKRLKKGEYKIEANIEM
ncbi:MAG: hypothetical protein IPM23_07125 [Candidatus Melainabacteria bacterium]|nr:hypothetical protein [Candidatus Melainabacteria bacterium]